MPTIDPIRTPRLLLRDYVYDDWTAVHRYGSDPEVMRWLALPPNTEAVTRTFMERCMQAQQDEPRTTFELAVTLAASGELIGGCRVGMVTPRRREASIGYAFRRDQWGNGYATEAASALLRLGFEQLGAHRIFATCDTGNTGSYRVMEKLGMRREGLHLRNRQSPSDAQWRDSYYYAIIEDEWRASC